MRDVWQVSGKKNETNCRKHRKTRNENKRVVGLDVSGVVCGCGVRGPLWCAQANVVRPKGAATLRERSPQYTFVVGKRTLERRLRKTSDQLRALRDELRVIDEQIVHLGDEADDLDTRALVSDYPGAGADSRETGRLQKNAG